MKLGLAVERRKVSECVAVMLRYETPMMIDRSARDVR
jgi:hypothetical protein